MESSAPQTKKIIEALWRLQNIILETLDFKTVVQRIVDGLLLELGYLDLGYRIIVLSLLDEDKKVLRRISLSQTAEAERALKASAVPFHDIEIPLDCSDNFMVKAIAQNKPYITHNWTDLFKPVLKPEQAFENQTASGIKTSIVYPVVVRDKPIGVLIFSMVKSENEMTDDEKNLILGFTEIVGLAVQNAKLYSSIEKISEELKVANDKLKELDKKKDEFVSVASHELRTPMTAIRSYLWLALESLGGELTAKQKYYLDRSYLSTVRLIKLVNDMLNISRIESGRVYVEPSSVDMVKLANEVISEVKPRADEQKLQIIVEPGDQKLPEVLADSDKIKEVLINLIGNSLKFTYAGGTIKITFTLKDGMVITSVTDNGEGMAQEDMPKLFQKFGLVSGSYVTNQMAAQGTGLGLYISRSIIEMLGGKIWAQSEGKGHGSTFSFSLKTFNAADCEAIKTAQAGKEPVGIIHSSID